MNFYMKQRLSLFGDKFTIYDGMGEPVFVVEGEVFTWGKKLHLCNTFGEELAFVEQKIFSFLPKYYVHRAGIPTVEIIREFSFFKQEYTVNGLGWRVHGDFFNHEYVVDDGYRDIVRVSKQWFTLGDAYQISISDDCDVVAALAVILVVDACIEADRG